MRAQASFEFMVVYAALLTIFIIIFTVYFDGSLNLFQSQDRVAALRNAQSIAAAVNYVYLAGDGAGYDFKATNIINLENVTITDYSVTSTRPHASASVSLVVGGVNVSSQGRNDTYITNNAGEINIG